MHIMLPILFHTELTLMIYQYPHCASHSANFEGSYDILYAKYVDAVLKNDLKMIFKPKEKMSQKFSESVDVVETEKHWCQKLALKSQ